MIKIHMYWMQGWKNAPPRAKRNRDLWKNAGFDVTTWDDDNVEIKWNQYFPAAMRADITLAKAMYVFGGIAMGADSSPLDTETFKKSISFLPPTKGQLIWQSKSSTQKERPYIAGSYFPKGNQFIGEVVKHHKKLLNCKFNSSDLPLDPLKYSGPGLWASVYKEFSNHVNVIDGQKAFLTEPRSSVISDVAWLDAGFANDWNATKKEIWN
jgi:hypothetical protein